MEMTIEQKRALAMAAARARASAAPAQEAVPERKFGEDAPENSLTAEPQSFGQAAAQFIVNLPGDAARTAGSVYDAGKYAVTHPVEVGKGALGLMKGTAEQAFQMPVMSEDRKAVLGIGPNYAADLSNAYGDKQKILNTIAQHPMRVILDASTLSTGVGGLAAKGPGIIGRTGAAMRDASIVPGLPTVGRKVAEGIDSMVSKPKYGPAPSVEELKGRASSLYDAARENGVTASQADVQGTVGNMMKAAQDNGFVSPTGEITSAYPKVREALRTMDAFAQGEMTVPQMQSARKTLQNVAQSTDASEARFGSMMLREFDNFTAPLAPELKQARGLYHKAMKGDEIDGAIERAAIRAGQYSGSGYENALRTEFRQLAMKLQKGQLSGYSPEEIAAIRKVSDGGPLENGLRTLGKLAPTGPVSFLAGGGVPYMIGSSIGGPVVGSMTAGGSMGAGFLARAAATKMATRNAAKAGDLVRGGETLVAPAKTPVQSIARLLNEATTSGVNMTPTQRKIALLLAAQTSERQNATK